MRQSDEALLTELHSVLYGRAESPVDLPDGIRKAIIDLGTMINSDTGVSHHSKTITVDPLTEEEIATKLVNALRGRGIRL